jgi:flagella basal body P-ring formation protein FlgA
VIKKILLAFALFVVVAISAITVALIMANQRLEKWKASGAPDFGQIVCAEVTIPAGHVITEDDVAEISAAADQIEPDSLICSQYVVGEKTKTEVRCGEVISADALMSGGKDKLDQQAKQLAVWLADNKKDFCHHDRGNFGDIDPDMTVSAVADIPEGALFSLENVGYAKSEENRSSLLSGLWQAVGRPSHWGMSKDQSISLYDIDCRSKVSVPVLIAAHDISEGSPIKAEDTEIEKMSASECPATAICDAKLLDGCVAYFNIPKGAILRAAHFARKN